VGDFERDACGVGVSIYGARQLATYGARRDGDDGSGEDFGESGGGWWGGAMQCNLLLQRGDSTRIQRCYQLLRPLCVVVVITISAF